MSPSTVSNAFKRAGKTIEGLESFHFHMLRHTFTTNLISGGAEIKDVQELLGHTDANTTMSIYAHSTREAKRTSARLLDKVRRAAPYKKFPLFSLIRAKQGKIHHG